MGGIVGIDVGGTFTDLFYSEDGVTAHTVLKVPSTPDDPSRGLVDELVAAWTAGFDKQPLFDLLIARHVPCAPVRDLDEVVNDPHMHARGALMRMEHPELGVITVPRSALRFAGTALTELTPSGALGAENDSVYGEWLGLSAGELDTPRREGVI
jgi:crotonobetainyl-CoA:carnitine CoA-transferase CaiB-like acyl-CoA transferase